VVNHQLLVDELSILGRRQIVDFEIEIKAQHGVGYGLIFRIVKLL
jgi:hypothetical protein